MQAPAVGIVHAVMVQSSNATIEMVAVEEVRELRAALARGGLRDGLRYANARTPHRFTGLYRFDGDTLTNLFLIDREYADAAPVAPFPVADSFCALVRESNAPFVLGNALFDPRVASHPARARIIAYCGIPLQHPTGELFGSLCHFDHKPVLLSHLDLPFMLAVAATLIEALINASFIHE